MILIGTFHITTEFYNEEADFFLSAYAQDRSPAIVAIALDKSPIMTVTTWIGDFTTPAPRCAFIKDYAENRGILEELIKYRLLEPTGRVVKNQYVHFPECKILLTEDQWAEFDRHYPKVN